jgi:hypothetical protein
MMATNDANEDVARAISELGLASKLEAVLAGEARRLYDAIEARFASSTRARWIWEHFRTPGVSYQLAGDGVFGALAEIVPSATALLLYFPGSDEDVVAAYRGTIDAIVAVIGDCSFHEYVVSPLGAEWLVCENHHGVVIAVGEPVESRLRSLSPATPGPDRRD